MFFFLDVCLGKMLKTCTCKSLLLTFPIITLLWVSTEISLVRYIFMPFFEKMGHIICRKVAKVGTVNYMKVSRCMYSFHEYLYACTCNVHHEKYILIKYQDFIKFFIKMQEIQINKSLVIILF